MTKQLELFADSMSEAYRTNLTYTADEDRMILDLVDRAREAGIDLEPACEMAAKELHRPAGGIEQRYYRLKRERQKEQQAKRELEVLHRRVSSSTDKSIDAETVLRNVKNLRLERDNYKQQALYFRSLCEDYKMVYTELRNEYNNLLKEIDKGLAQ